MAMMQTERPPSLPEVHRTVNIPNRGGFWRKLLAYAGPGYLVSVGYMDPGNWATDLAGGSKFGYSLLSVILLSNLMAILLQALCVKLGVATGRDLAQSCRDNFSQPVNFCLWVLCEVAISACDLAELVGSAIALQLLFHLPLAVGVCLTALDTFAILFLQHKGFRYLEALVIAVIALVGGCFITELIFARPDVGSVFQGFIPQAEIVRNPEALYIAIGILGATVMPHNLYLHSSIVQTRNWQDTPAKKREAIKFGTIDSTIALSLALFINAAILILAAAVFYVSGRHDVAEIQAAYKLLSPMLGVAPASAIFAIALLASGQNSTLTATMAGQIVMEGFLNIRLKPWLRRLVTRLVAIVPALLAIVIMGEGSATSLLILSQVILSLQLPFAIVPLIVFTNDRKLMGEFVNPRWVKVLAYAVTTIIVGLNGWLLVQMLWNNLSIL
jgi:manganese transport protein